MQSNVQDNEEAHNACVAGGELIITSFNAHAIMG